MNNAQRYAETLLQRYAAYHDHKENAAWAAFALYAAAFTGAVVSSAWPPRWWPGWLLYVAPTAVAAFAWLFVGWQLGRRRIAAVRAAGAEALLGRWLTMSPSDEDLRLHLPIASAAPKGWERWWDFLQRWLLWSGNSEGDLTDDDYPRSLVEICRAQAKRGTKAQSHEWLMRVGIAALLVAVLIKTWACTSDQFSRPAPLLLAELQGSDPQLTSASPLLVTVVDIVSTAVIALFAVLQWWLSRNAENSRKAERQADQLERADVAYATVHAEWFRIWTVSEQWRASELANPAVIAAKSPDDILPRDWASVTQNLAQLGYLPAQIGGMGLALTHDASRHARALFDEVMAYNQMRPNAPEAAARFDQEHMPRLLEAEANLKELASEAANVLEDAVAHAEAARRVRESPAWNDVLHSKYTRDLKAKLEARVARGTGSPGSPGPN